jgi:chromosome segregation ATPase
MAAKKKDGSRELERLRNDFHQGLELLARAEDENENLTKDKASLQQKLRKAKDELEEQRSYYKGKRQEMVGHSKELAQLRSTAKVLRFELDAAKSSLSNKEDDLQELKGGYGQLLSLLRVELLRDETDTFDTDKTLELVTKAVRKLMATRDKQVAGERKLRDELAVQQRFSAGQLETLREEKKVLEQDVRALSLSAVDSQAESWAAQEQLKRQVQELHRELEHGQTRQEQQQQVPGWGRGEDRKHHLFAQLRVLRGEHQQCEATIAAQQEQLIKAREVFNGLSQRLERHGQQNAQWGAEKHQLVKTRSRLIGLSHYLITLVYPIKYTH